MNAHDDGVEANLSPLLKELEEGKTSPCYLLYGEEDYLIGDALAKMLDLLLLPESRDLNLFTLDGRENVDFLCDTLATPPLLPGRKVVLLRNTRLFHSRFTLHELIAKIREHLDREPGRAAGDFLQFLQLAGWRLDDFRDDGWRRITDEEWLKTVGENGEGREAWLPRIVEICVSRGADAAATKGDDAERLADFLKRGIPPGNHLILTADTADKRKKLFKVVAECGKIVFFPRPKGDVRQKQVLMAAAAELLAARGKRMTPAAWTALGDKTGFELRTSMGALEQLISYTGERMSIEEADVLKIVEKTKEDTLFALTAALVNRDAVRALRVLQDLLDQGTNHLAILSMIVREVRMLLQAKLFLQSGKLVSYNVRLDYTRFQKTVYPRCKDLAAATSGEDRSGLAAQHPYVIYNALRNAERFTSAALIAALETLLSIDISLKSTGRDPRLALERFLIGFCS